MSKPKGEKCKTCFVKNNRLRCSLCKWKTEEWFWNHPPAPITISGDEDLYEENVEQESKSDIVDAYIAGVVWGYNRGVKDCERGLQLSPETSTNDEEIIIKTGQTYGKSANFSKDIISEQIKKHVERDRGKARVSDGD